MYQLYTKGYGAEGKVPIVVAEAAADVFTIGLAELGLTPAEGVTRNETRAAGAPRPGAVQPSSIRREHGWPDGSQRPAAGVYGDSARIAGIPRLRS